MSEHTTAGWRCDICGQYWTGQLHQCAGSVPLSNLPPTDPAVIDYVRLSQRIADLEAELNGMEQQRDDLRVAKHMLEAELARLRAAPEVTVNPLKLARWILNRGNNWPDHACRQCFPDYPVEAGSCLERGIAEKFVCAFHLSEALVAGLRHAEKP
jgi:hypothetical protein